VFERDPILSHFKFICMDAKYDETTCSSSFQVARSGEAQKIHVTASVEAVVENISLNGKGGTKVAFYVSLSFCLLKHSLISATHYRCGMMGKSMP
jgi:hypothetical protein